LLRQRALHQAITQHLAEGEVVLDEEWCITFLNPAVERLLGWTGAEWPYQAPRAALANVLRSAAAGPQTVELELRRKDGVSVAAAVIAVPFLQEGKFGGAVLRVFPPAPPPGSNIRGEI
jgi:PAS domain-containing protein